MIECPISQNTLVGWTFSVLVVRYILARGGKDYCFIVIESRLLTFFRAPCGPSGYIRRQIA